MEYSSKQDCDGNSLLPINIGIQLLGMHYVSAAQNVSRTDSSWHSSHKHVPRERLVGMKGASGVFLELSPSHEAARGKSCGLFVLGIRFIACVLHLRIKLAAIRPRIAV